MKALIRHNGETVLETDNIEGIDWTTGAPLTNPSWCGGAYALSPYCPEDAIPEDFDISEVQQPTGETDDEGSPITITRRIAVLNQARYDTRISEESNDLSGN